MNALLFHSESPTELNASLEWVLTEDFGLCNSAKINTISKMRGEEVSCVFFFLFLSLIKITMKLCNSETICYINMHGVEVMQGQVDVAATGLQTSNNSSVTHICMHIRKNVYYVVTAKSTLLQSNSAAQGKIICSFCLLLSLFLALLHPSPHAHARTQ